MFAVIAISSPSLSRAQSSTAAQAPVNAAQQAPTNAAQTTPSKTNQKTSAKTAQTAPAKNAQKTPGKAVQKASIKAVPKTPPKTAPLTPRKPKLDLGYVTVEAAAAVAVFPRYVLTAPEMEMLPTEALRLFVNNEWGIDPLELEWLMVIVEAADDKIPGGAMILHMVSPVPQGKILARLWDHTSEDKLDGKVYRRGNGMTDLSIFRADDRTLLLATSSTDLLERMVHNHAKPKQGPLASVLSRVVEPPDAMIICQVPRMRSATSDLLRMASLSSFAAWRLSTLLASVDARANLTGNMYMSVTIQAKNKATAKQFQDGIDAALTMGRSAIAIEAANQATSNDPIQQALTQYAKQAGEGILRSLRPERKGETFTLSGTGKTPQMAAIGALMAILLPTVQAGAEPAASANDPKQARAAICNYLDAHGQFPFKSMVLALISDPPAEKERPPESHFLADTFSGDASVQVLRGVAYLLGFMALSIVVEFPISWLRRRKRVAQ
jgi:hypothetical protein